MGSAIRPGEWKSEFPLTFCLSEMSWSVEIRASAVNNVRPSIRFSGAAGLALPSGFASVRAARTRCDELGEVFGRELKDVLGLVANDLLGIGLEDVAEVWWDDYLLRAVDRVVVERHRGQGANGNSPTVSFVTAATPPTRPTCLHAPESDSE